MTSVGCRLLLPMATRATTRLLRRAGSERQLRFHGVRLMPSPLSAGATRGLATRSASSVVRAHGDDTAMANIQPNHMAPAAHETPATTSGGADASSNMLEMLDQSIAEREPSRALAYFQCLETPPSILTSQKLAILLAKQASLHQTRRAHEILLNVYSTPGFEVDDYTQLASIFVVDACLKQGMLAEATGIVECSHRYDLSLDLPAYDSLVRANIEAGKAEEAITILQDVLHQQEVVFQQETFQPVLKYLMRSGEYDKVIDLIDYGRKHSVVFTFDTYDPLVAMAEAIDDSDDEELWDTLERFMSYINEALEEDGFAGFSEEDVEETLAVELDYHDDDDDDDDHDEDFDDEY